LPVYERNVLSSNEIFIYKEPSYRLVPKGTTGVRTCEQKFTKYNLTPQMSSNRGMTNQSGHLRFGMLIAGAVACASILWAASLRHGAASQDNSSQSGQTQLSNQTATYEGIVTDSRCGAKHSAAVGLSAGDCTRACVHAGEHFTLVDGDKIYVLEGETDALKHSAGERVKIQGTLNGDTISVASIATGSP
jgi:hypothetical protein